MDEIFFPSLSRALVATAVAWLAPIAVLAAEDRSLESDAAAAYQKLVATVPAADALGKRAIAVLVFPKVTKAGLVVGGQHGEGVLFKGGKAVGFYTTTGASYGLQAGAQTYGYAMFLMHDNAVQALDESSGFEVGMGPSLVVVDQGAAKNITTTTMKDDIYAFIFGQKGLMAGVGLQGNKISRLEK